MKYFILLGLLISTLAQSAALVDPRMCGFVPRDENGNIKRSSAAISAFRSLYPCPATGLKTGACEGWAIDHSISLACGGCDQPGNMMWIPNKAKSCSDNWCKDRYERNMFYVDPATPGLNPKGCSPKLLPAEYFEIP